jgi:hypothetical protein
VSFGSLMVHPLAIVIPNALADPTIAANLTEYGQAEPGSATVTLVRGMVQPRKAREAALTTEDGAEIADYTIFLQMQSITGAAYIVDADAGGPLAGGRKFQIQGIRPYEFGSVPHLEVDCLLIGNTEKVSVGS